VLFSSSTSAAAHSHIPAKKCKKAAKDLHMCVLKVIADDATGAKASAWENVITEAEGCYTAAGDDKAAQEACAMPVLELSAEDCPSGFDALLKACAPTSFEFEDFVLDLAEELEFERFAEELAEEIAEEISEELEGGELLLSLFLSAQRCLCMMHAVTVPRVLCWVHFSLCMCLYPTAVSLNQLYCPHIYICTQKCVLLYYSIFHQPPSGKAKRRKISSPRR
jgi:hypothetical protein